MALIPLRSSLALTAALVLGAISQTLAFSPAQWPDCDCPDALCVELVSWNFENMLAGVPVSSAPPSQVHPDVISSDLFGPGNVMASAPGGVGTDPWACFGGFAADGSPGSIYFKMSYGGPDLFTLCGFQFDAFSEGVEGGLHGPTSLFVNVYANGVQVWQSELVNLIPGFNNKIHWDISNPDGNDANGDGISLTGSDFSWMKLTAGDDLAFEIVAAGATTSLVGLDIDNVAVLACVPEPSGAVLLLLAGMMMVVRFRRSRILSA
jgi:hypothetical protein